MPTASSSSSLVRSQQFARRGYNPWCAFLFCLLLVLSLTLGQMQPAQAAPKSNWSDNFTPPGPNANITAMAQTDDAIYVGGGFTEIDEVKLNYIARYDKSTGIWSSVGGGLNGPVASLVTMGGDLYVGGEFDRAGSIDAFGIAKWDGTTWSTLGDGMDGPVQSLAVNGTDLYAGGYFSYAGGAFANNIAKWDGISWTDLGEGTDAPVLALAVRDDPVEGPQVYAGGVFTQAGTVSAAHIAQWNDQTLVWSEMGGGTDAPVLALAVTDNNVYAAGLFQEAGDETVYGVARWDGITWFEMAGGLDNPAASLHVVGTDVYVGGAFQETGDGPANGIAKWDETTRSFSPLGDGVQGIVLAITVDGSNVYAAGAIFSAGNIAAVNIARWDGSTWSGLATRIGDGLNDNTNVIVDAGDAVYVAGNFTSAGNFLANYIACWNKTTRSWSTLGSGLNGPVYALALSGNDLYVGGSFDTAGGIPANNIAKWNRTTETWSALGDGSDNSVYALAVDGTNVYAGGSFSNAGGNPANCIARWDGTTWSALGEGTDNSVYALAFSGGALYAGGGFSNAGAVSANYIAKWDGNNWSALGDGTDSYVNAIVFSGTDLYAGGDFYTAGGAPANNIAKWDGTAWSPLGDGVNDSVYALAFHGTDLYVGGDFSTAGSESANNIAKWDGTDWSPLGGGVDNSVYALATSSPYLYAGGIFNFADDQTSFYIGEYALFPDGSGPTVTIETVNNDQRIPLSQFYAGSIQGRATDDRFVAGVRVQLLRYRNGAYEYWNGTAFTPSKVYVNATLGSVDKPYTIWSLQNHPEQSLLDIGSYALYVYAVDNAGNKGTPVRRDFVLTDDITPILRELLPDSKASIPMDQFRTGSINGIATDNHAVASVQVQLLRYRNGAYECWNGRAFTTTRRYLAAKLGDPGTTATTWSLQSHPSQGLLDVGDYALYVYVLDKAGNKSLQVRRDFRLTNSLTSAPELVITTPTPNQSLAKSDSVAGTIKGTATDDRGVASVQVQLIRFRGGAYEYWNGTDFDPAKVYLPAKLGTPGGKSTSWNLQNHPSQDQLDTGSYALYVYALDASGNKSLQLRREFTLTQNLSVQESAPVTSPSAPSS